MAILTRKLSAFLAVLVVGAICVACGGGGGDNAGNAPAKPKVILRKPVPQDFKDKKPPAGFDLKAAANIEAGKKLFEGAPKAGCYTCHGNSGKGDGEQAKGPDVNPKPTDLTSAEFQSVTDDYIFWRVMTGPVGGPQGTIMTGLAGATDEEAWQLVAYVRSLAGK